MLVTARMLRNYGDASSGFISFLGTKKKTMGEPDCGDAIAATEPRRCLIGVYKLYWRTKNPIGKPDCGGGTDTTEPY